MKKLYTKPMLEYVFFNCEDIITTSTLGEGESEDLPWETNPFKGLEG